MPESATVPAPPTPEAENPWREYGLNPDGTPIEPKKEPEPDPRDAKIAALEKQLEAASAKLEKIPADVEGLAEKAKIIDRLVKAVSGEEDPNTKLYEKVWADIKAVAPPGVRKAMEILERDPEAIERLTGSVDALHLDRLTTLNARAHERVLELAKQAFPVKGLSPAEMNELVFPFERAMTDLINGNETLRKRFVLGDITVVEELFNRLVKPHVAARLREKQKRAEAVAAAPKAVPKGAGGPGASVEGEEKKPDIRTPKGRAEFHRRAVARFFAKRAAAEEEE